MATYNLTADMTEFNAVMATVNITADLTSITGATPSELADAVQIMTLGT